MKNNEKKLMFFDVSNNFKRSSTIKESNRLNSNKSNRMDINKNRKSFVSSSKEENKIVKNAKSNKTLIQDNERLLRNIINKENDIKFLMNGGEYETSDINFVVNFLRKNYKNNKMDIKLKNDAEYMIKVFCRKGNLKCPLWTAKPSKVGEICPGDCQWTGKLLEILGYNNLEYVGKGAYNTVWKNNKGEVFRVNFGKDLDEEAINANVAINDLVSNNQKDKNSKYIDKLETIDGCRVFKGKLAEDSFAYLEKGSRMPKGISKKSARSFLNHMADALKGMILIKSKNFTHNDIKPSNWLKIQKDLSKLNQKVKEGKLRRERGKDGKVRYFDAKTGEKISKKYLAIGDFDLLSNDDLDYLGETPRKGSPLFMDWQLMKNSSASKAQLGMRDMYSLGISFIVMICRSIGNWHANSFSEIGDGQAYRKKTIDQLWGELLFKIYDPKEEKRVKSALKLAYRMSDNDVRRRPQSYEECLDKVNELRGKDKKTKARPKKSDPKTYYEKDVKGSYILHTNRRVWNIGEGFTMPSSWNELQRTLGINSHTMLYRFLVKNGMENDSMLPFIGVLDKISFGSTSDVYDYYRAYNDEIEALILDAIDYLKTIENITHGFKDKGKISKIHQGKPNIIFTYSRKGCFSCRVSSSKCKFVINWKEGHVHIILSSPEGEVFSFSQNVARLIEKEYGVEYISKIIKGKDLEKYAKVLYEGMTYSWFKFLQENRLKIEGIPDKCPGNGEVKVLKNAPMDIFSYYDQFAEHVNNFVEYVANYVQQAIEYETNIGPADGYPYEFPNNDPKSGIKGKITFESEKEFILHAESSLASLKGNYDGNALGISLSLVGYWIYSLDLTLDLGKQ